MEIDQMQLKIELAGHTESNITEIKRQKNKRESLRQSAKESASNSNFPRKTQYKMDHKIGQNNEFVLADR